MALQKRKFELSPRLKLGVGRGYSQNQILKLSALLCLLLAIGLSFNAIRLIFSTKNQAIENNNTPQVLGVNDTRTNSAESMEFINYSVIKGDTLFNISQKFNISWTTLATLNNLKSPFYLKLGQTIKVPKQ